MIRRFLVRLIGGYLVVGCLLWLSGPFGSVELTGDGIPMFLVFLIYLAGCHYVGKLLF